MYITGLNCVVSIATPNGFIFTLVSNVKYSGAAQHRHKSGFIVGS